MEKNPQTMIIGIPSKGRPKQLVQGFLEQKGHKIPDDQGRKLQMTFINQPDHILAFFHAKDIANLVDQGFIDVGFTGLDLLQETKASVRPVIKLNLGKVKMVVAVRNDSHYTHPYHLMHKKIATPFPQIAKSYFERINVPVSIYPISGSSEGFSAFSIVDAIIDVMETGNTIRENDLRVITEDVFDSEMICIVKKPEFQVNHRLIHKFLRSLYD
jgi:ATP phosphoribosyltransferase